MLNSTYRKIKINSHGVPGIGNKIIAWLLFLNHFAIMERRKLLTIVTMFFILALKRQQNITVQRQLSAVREQMYMDFLSDIDMLLLITFVLHRRRLRYQRENGFGRRRAWAWPRPQNWFAVLLASPQMSHMWKPNFRMTRATFEQLCDILRANLTKRDTRMRKAWPVEWRVAVAIWRLATGDTYRSSGLQFGMGEATAFKCCVEFETVLGNLKNKYIRFPFYDGEVQEAMDRFEELYKFPQIVGAIDGSHIEIKAPPVNHEDYFNRKQFYSIVLQGIVDSDLLFRHVAVGYPGSVHDSRVLQCSGVRDLADDGTIFKSPIKIIQGEEVRPMLVGDSAYPLSSWLIKPFPYRANLLQHEKKFNQKLSAMRAVVERAFGLLKGRWRITAKKNEQYYTTVKRTVTAACVLHNFCLLQGDSYDDYDMTNNNDEDGNDDDQGLAWGVGGDETRELILNYMIAEEFI